MKDYDIARAATAEDYAATGRYPALPAGWCRHGSMVLALTYPELRVAEGHVLVTRGQGKRLLYSQSIAHAWNMTRDRLIVDATLHGPTERQVLVDHTAKLAEPDAWITVTYTGHALDDAEWAERYEADGAAPLHRKILRALRNGMPAAVLAQDVMARTVALLGDDQDLLARADRQVMWRSA